MKSILVPAMILAAVPLLPSSFAAAQAPPPAEKKAGKPAAEPGAAQAGAGKALTAREKSQKRSRMRRLYQTGQYEKLAEVVQNSLTQADPQRDRDVLKDAAYYKAGLAGHSGDEKGFWEWVEKAIGYGFVRADGFEDLSLIPESIKSSERFKTRMQKLRKESEDLLWSEFVKSVSEGLARPSVESFRIPEEGAIGPNPFAGEKLRGRPACVVLTPIQHDGFRKQLPLLERMAEKYGDRVGLAVFFYQYDPKDAGRSDQTANFIRDEALVIPTAIVGREYVKPLEIPSYPGLFFLNAEGKVAYRSDGYLPEKKLDFVLGELAQKSARAPEQATSAPPAIAPRPAEDPKQPLPAAAPAAAEKNEKKPAAPATKPPAPAAPPPAKPETKPAEKPAEKKTP